MPDLQQCRQIVPVTCGIIDLSGTLFIKVHIGLHNPFIANASLTDLLSNIKYSHWKLQPQGRFVNLEHDSIVLSPTWVSSFHSYILGIRFHSSPIRRKPCSIL